MDRHVLRFGVLLTVTLVAFVGANRHPQYALLTIFNDEKVLAIERVLAELQSARLRRELTEAFEPVKRNLSELMASQVATHDESLDLFYVYLTNSDDKSPGFFDQMAKYFNKATQKLADNNFLTERQPRAMWDLQYFAFSKMLATKKFKNATLSKTLETFDDKIRAKLKEESESTGMLVLDRVVHFRYDIEDVHPKLLGAVNDELYDQMSLHYDESAAHKDTPDGEIEPELIPPTPEPTTITPAPTPSRKPTTSLPKATPAAPVDTLADTLNDDDETAPPTSTGTEDNSSSSSTILLASVVIAMSVLCACAMWIVVRQRQRTRLVNKREDKTDETERTTTISSSDEVANTPTADQTRTIWQDPVLETRRIAIDQIKFGSVIGRGAFGSVYVGRFNGQKVAIKQLLPEKRKDPIEIDRFGAEIKLMCSLDHPRIVHCVGVAWNSPSDACVLTEFMAGGDLRTTLDRFAKQGRPVGFDPIKLKIALHIANALGYLHCLRPVVLHRDLKSRNVLLTPEYDAKLTDFGVARDCADHTMTAGVGSSLWMAPEVILGNRYCEKADVFSFGVVLSELDSHMLPYANRTDENADDAAGISDVALQHRVAMGHLRVTFSGIGDPDLVALAQSCVATNPSDRPTTTMVLYRLQQASRRVEST